MTATVGGFLQNPRLLLKLLLPLVSYVNVIYLVINVSPGGAVSDSLSLSLLSPA